MRRPSSESTQQTSGENLKNLTASVGSTLKPAIFRKDLLPSLRGGGRCRLCHDHPLVCRASRSLSPSSMLERDERQDSWPIHAWRSSSYRWFWNLQHPAEIATIKPIGRSTSPIPTLQTCPRVVSKSGSVPKGASACSPCIAEPVTTVSNQARSPPRTISSFRRRRRHLPHRFGF